MISMHQILAAKYLQAKMENNGGFMSLNYGALVYPDAVRAYGVTRKASHFEVNPETGVESRIAFPDNLKSADKHYYELCTDFDYYNEPDVAPAAIGEDSSLEAFRESNRYLPDSVNDGLELHLKQDIVFDKTLREVVDCKNKYNDTYFIVGDGNVPSKKLNGEELRKSIGVMDNAGMLHLVGKIYELTGELCDQKWFDDNVKPALQDKLPQDLADSAYKYMKYSDATAEHIAKHEFDGHDAKLYDTFAMRSEDLDAMYDMMECYYLHDTVDVPFHMIDRKEQQKAKSSVEVFNKSGEFVYVNMSNDAPAINTMKAGVDTFDKEVSIPGKIVDSEYGGADKIVVAFEKSYDVGWTGGYEDHYVQHFVNSESGYIFDAQNVSHEPKHEIAKPVQTMRERMTEKLMSKSSEADKHELKSADRSVTD